MSLADRLAKSQQKDRISEVRQRVQERLVDSLGPRLYDASLSDTELEGMVHQRLRELLDEEEGVLSAQEKLLIVRQIGDSVLGLGPLEPYIRDPEVTEVMVNNWDTIYVERGGKLYWTGTKFHDEGQLRRTIDKIVAKVGRRVDEASPMVDARLPDGSRVNAIIPDDERIVTIEDAAELKLQQPHVVRLESRPPNIEGKGQVAIRDLVRNSLRMRPDRIIVGEVRGAESLDMLQAMNTGHDGSLCTVHANAPRDGLHRIETMVLMAGYDLPLRAIRQHVSSALDLLVHIDRLEDGSRRVVQVTEVLRMESDVIQLQDIFEFEIQSVAPDRTITGALRPTGLRPVFLEKFRKRGIELPQSMFGERVTLLDERRGATA